MWVYLVGIINYVGIITCFKTPPWGTPWEMGSVKIGAVETGGRIF